MTVGELKKLLRKHPNDMEVLFCQFSDYAKMKPEDIKVVEAVDKDHYFMRSHPTMSEENKQAVKTYLIFPGN